MPGPTQTKDAPINLYGVRGKNALQAASSEGKGLVVQFLLDQGADVNVPAHEDGGRTALQAAVERGRENVAKCLLDAQANIRAPPAKKNGMTVLEAFANSSWGYYHGDITSRFRNWLSQGAPINRLDGDHGNLLHGLIHRIHHKSAYGCLDLALQAGARIEVRDQGRRGQMTPLQVAAEIGNLDTVRLLLKYRADVNAPPGDEFGRTALQAAVCGKNPVAIHAMVEYLLSVGADVNAPPGKKGGITALAQILLDHGADVNAAPGAEEGRTAIEGAAEHGRLDMVRFLIGAGAAADAEKGFGRAIELAENEKCFISADFLREQQDMSAGLGAGMEDLFGGGDFSQMSMPMPGFVFSEENLGNLMDTFQ
ncbi:ankyrin [Colletotrichum falcatum]|nr:ankyrin [Colletotrichum falcatum]